jgi:hypothetical protein
MFDKDEVVITAIKWDGEDAVEFEFNGNMMWCGAKAKDFWQIQDWKKVLKVGTTMYLWCIQSSRVIGMQCVTESGEVVDVWCCANDFDYEKDRKKRENKYNRFIEREGKKIAKWIDQGKSYDQINDLIDKGHTGNTFGCAMAIGINTAKNWHNAVKVKNAHNAQYGVPKSETGVVNPAIMTIEVK